MIDQALTFNDPKLLFDITDKIKHSLLRYDLNLADSTDLMSIEEHSSKIYEGKDLAIIQFGFSSDSLYAVVQENETFKTHMLAESESINYNIKTCKDLISQKNKRQELNLSLYELYTILFEPLNINSDKIRIIPVGELANLPFGAFLNDQNDPVSFLIKEKSFEYQYSQSLYNSINDRNYNKRDIGLFAPQFDRNPNQVYSTDIRGSVNDTLVFYHLPYAQQEIDILSDIWSTPQSTIEKESLKYSIENNRMTHFAGHAFSYSDQSEKSFLALDSDFSKKENKMTLDEIYTYQCRNDLVVLSACETGAGKIAQSEGVLSLSRGFFFAGAKSIVSTLWSVSDKATTDIILELYNELFEGHQKDASLRNAKLTYLKTHDPEFHHPYYWSGIIAVGDMSAIKAPSANLYLWIMLGCVFLFSFLFYKFKH